MASALFVDYISGCELYDLFITYDSELELSNLFVGTCGRVWNLWFLCGYMSRLWGLESVRGCVSQNFSSLICLMVSVPWCEGSALFVWHLKCLSCLWLCVPSCEVWNLFVRVCPNMGISRCVWGVVSGGVRCLIYSLVSEAGCEASDLFEGDLKT